MFTPPTIPTPDTRPQWSVSAASPQQVGPQVSVIGPDLKIHGEQIQIVASDKLQLDGEVIGDVFGTDVVIGENGLVGGIVVANRMEIHGRVTGTIYAKELIVGRTGRVDAEMNYAKLTLSEGGLFEGRSRRLDENAALPGPRGASVKPV